MRKAIFSLNTLFQGNHVCMFLFGLFQKRSEAVATYALCGFSNIGAIGINMGAVLAFAPSRRVDLPRLVIRAMICGSAACFLTGAVAGKV